MLVRTAFSNVAILVVNFATGLLAARFLEAEGRGHYALLLLYPQLCSYVAMMGWDRSLAIVIGQRLVAAPTRLVMQVIVGSASVSLVATGACITVAIQEPWLRDLALLFAAHIPAYVAFTLFVATHMGRGDFNSYNVSRGAYYAAYLLLVLGAIATGHASVHGFAMAYGTAAWLGAAVAGWRFLRYRGLLGNGELANEDPQTPTTRPLSWRGLLQLHVPFVLPAWIYGFAANVDRVLLSALVDARSLGVFVVYTSYVALIGPVANAVNATVFHRSLARGSETDFATFARLTSLVYAAMLGGLGLMADFLIRLLYGPSFATDLNAAYVLLASGFFMSASQVLNEHLKGQRSTVADLASNGIYVVLAFSGGWVLVQRAGLVGLAAAVSLANLGRYLCIALYFRHKVGGSLAALMVPRPSDVALGWRLVRAKLHRRREAT